MHRIILTYLILLSSFTTFCQDGSVSDSVQDPIESFTLQDTAVRMGQGHIVYDICFKPLTAELEPSIQPGIDSVINFFKKLKITKFFVIYYEEKKYYGTMHGKQGWEKAAAIKNYIVKKGIPADGIMTKCIYSAKSRDEVKKQLKNNFDVLVNRKLTGKGSVNFYVLGK